MITMAKDESFEMFVKFMIGIILIFVAFVIPTYGEYFFLIQLILGFAGLIVILMAAND